MKRGGAVWCKARTGFGEGSAGQAGLWLDENSCIENNRGGFSQCFAVLLRPLSVSELPQCFSVCLPASFELLPQ